jgi:hypothetical protein
VLSVRGEEVEVEVHVEVKILQIEVFKGEGVVDGSKSRGNTVHCIPYVLFIKDFSNQSLIKWLRERKAEALFPSAFSPQKSDDTHPLSTEGAWNSGNERSAKGSSVTGSRRDGSAMGFVGDPGHGRRGSGVLGVGAHGIADACGVSNRKSSEGL